MRDRGDRLSSLSDGVEAGVAGVAGAAAVAATLANILLMAELLFELLSEWDCVASCRCDRTDFPLRFEDAFTSKTL